MPGSRSNRTADLASVLVAIALAVVAFGTGRQLGPAVAGIVAVLFAGLAWALRGVDLKGAVTGGALAFVFYDNGGKPIFGVLLVVFVITLAATKIAGRR